MSFYPTGQGYSYQGQPYPQQLFNPIPVASAPAFDEETESLYPQWAPAAPQPAPTYPLQPAQPYVQHFHSEENNNREIANQAYLNIWNDLGLIANLPPLDLDNRAIQTLNQLEDKAKQGFVQGLFTLMIKVMQVVGKLAVVLAVGLSIALLASSGFVPSLVIGKVFLGGITCQVAARIFQKLRKNTMEHSFRVALEKDEELMQQVKDLKAWKKIEKLADINVRLQETMKKIQCAQQTAGYDQGRDDQEKYLTFLRDKIARFYAIEEELNCPLPMPLLNRVLAD